MMGVFTGFIYFEWKNKNETVVSYVKMITESVPARVCFYLLGIGLVNLALWIVIPFQTGE